MHVHDKCNLSSLETLRSVVGFHGKPATEPRWVDRDAATMASVAPTAMPTSAADRAARSLIPSPQNRVVLPKPCDENTESDKLLLVTVSTRQYDDAWALQRHY